MANALIRNLNPGVKLLLFVVMAIVGMGVFAILGGLFIALKHGISFSEIAAFSASLDPEAVRATVILNTFVMHLGMFLFPAFLFYVIFGRNSVNGFWLKKIGWKIILIPVLIISIQPLIEGLIILNEWMIPEGSWLESIFKPSEDKINELTSVALQMPDVGSFLQNVLLIAIIPAIAEEITFRGVLQSQIAKRSGNVHVAIWVSAFVFSFIHMQFYGFFPRLFLGALFGYLLIWTGSMWAPIFAHFLNNFAGVSLAYLSQHELLDFNVEDNLSPEYTGSFIILSLVSAAIVYLLYKGNTWSKIKQAYLNYESA